jgi:plasmid stabilization system protein ParE
MQSAGGRRFYNEVSERIGSLREHPYMFPLYHDEKLSADGLRFIVIGNYLMFYAVDEDHLIISIIRILYGKREIPSAFA